MKVRQVIPALAVLGAFLVSAIPSTAQTSDTNAVTPGNSVRDGQVVLPGSDSLSGVTSPTGNDRPERPERSILPQDVRVRLQEFEKLRENYLARQQELLRKLRGASDADRARIRETLREQREAWQEQARRFREDAQRRLEELKIELPRHREILDRVRDSRPEAKPGKDRHGQD
jgi:hypothetical protein